MKKFLMYCIVLVVMLFLGFTTYYFVANKEQIILAFDQTNTLKMNVGETLALDNILTHSEPSSSTKIIVEITDTTILSYNEETRIFSANSAGACILTIKPTNTKFGPFIINVKVGNGLTTEYPIFISDAEELNSIGRNGSVWTVSLNYELISDIRLTNIDWTPIANVKTNPFTGCFNGAGYTIYNLTMTPANVSNIGGLFGYVGGNGIIKNVKFAEANLQGSYNSVGIATAVNNGVVCLVDISNSTIINNSNTGATGAVVGTNDITNSQSASIGMCGVQTTKIKASGYVGGIVGVNNAGVIENSFAVLDSFESASASTYFGGIAGSNMVYNNMSATIKFTHAGCTAITNSGTTAGIAGKTNDQTTGFKNIYTRNYFTLNTQNFVGTSRDFGANNIVNKSILEMKNKTTYIDWDFSTIWLMGENYAVINYATPYTSSVRPIDPIDPTNPTPTDPINPTPTDPETPDDLYQIVEEMRANPSSGKTYVLRTSQTANLTLSPWNSKEWVPIGTRENPFTCKFMTASGVNITFANLTVGDYQYAGFFGYVGSGAVISGINFQNTTINTNASATGVSSGYTGVVAGYLGTNATVANCSVSGVDINAYDNVGVLVGINYGTVQNCEITSTNTNKVSTNSANVNVGAIAGTNEGTLFNNNAKSVKISLSTNSSGNAGGIVGINNGNITNNKAENGEIITTSTNILRAGGIAGLNNKIIKQSNAKGMKISLSLSSNSAYAGGIAGVNATSGNILTSSNIAPNISSYYAGGIVADNYGKVQNSIAGSEALGTGVVGGVVVGGLAVINNINGYFGNCGVYATLEGLAGNSNTNGFAYGLKGGSNIENCFSNATLTGKGNFNADTDTPYRNWLSGAISNLPLSEKMGGITNSLLVNVSDKYVQGYGVVLDWFPNGIITRFDVVLTPEIAKGSDNFDTFIQKGFDESSWSFTIGKCPTPRI